MGSIRDSPPERAETPGLVDPVLSRTPPDQTRECASRPETQLTIEMFPEWCGEIPVPYNVIPF